MERVRICFTNGVYSDVTSNDDLSELYEKIMECIDDRKITTFKNNCGGKQVIYNLQNVSMVEYDKEYEHGK